MCSLRLNSYSCIGINQTLMSSLWVYPTTNCGRGPALGGVDEAITLWYGATDFQMMQLRLLRARPRG